MLVMVIDLCHGCIHFTLVGIGISRLKLLSDWAFLVTLAEHVTCYPTCSTAPNMFVA